MSHVLFRFFLLFSNLLSLWSFLPRDNSSDEMVVHILRALRNSRYNNIWYTVSKEVWKIKRRQNRTIQLPNNSWCVWKIFNFSSFFLSISLAYLWEIIPRAWRIFIAVHLLGISVPITFAGKNPGGCLKYIIILSSKRLSHQFRFA